MSRHRSHKKRMNDGIFASFRKPGEEEKVVELDVHLPHHVLPTPPPDEPIKGSDEPIKGSKDGWAQPPVGAMPSAGTCKDIAGSKLMGLGGLESWEDDYDGMGFPSGLNSDVPPMRAGEAAGGAKPPDPKPVVTSYPPYTGGGGVGRVGGAYTLANDEYDKYSKHFPAYSICIHDGTKPVWEADGITVSGARGDEITGYEHDLVVDLAGAYATWAESSFVGALPAGNTRIKPVEWVKLRRFHCPAPYLRLHWKDYTAPAMPLAFWQELWALCVAAGVKNLAFACQGGHGRTGTALAAVMLVSSGPDWTLDEIVAAIRKYHCTKAVENTEQVKYLRRLEQARDVEWEVKSNPKK